MSGKVQQQGVDAWGSPAAGRRCAEMSRQRVDAWGSPAERGRCAEMSRKGIDAWGSQAAGRRCMEMSRQGFDVLGRPAAERRCAEMWRQGVDVWEVQQQGVDEPRGSSSAALMEVSDRLLRRSPAGHNKKITIKKKIAQGVSARVSPGRAM